MWRVRPLFARLASVEDLDALWERYEKRRQRAPSTPEGQPKGKPMSKSAQRTTPTLTDASLADALRTIAEMNGEEILTADILEDRAFNSLSEKLEEEIFDRMRGKSNEDIDALGSPAHDPGELLDHEEDSVASGRKSEHYDFGLEEEEEFADRAHFRRGRSRRR